MPFLSIVTPTYNRADLLPSCYRSLCVQTDKDFEWIIVDDGSQDNTEATVGTFSTVSFPITYVKKENGGKHTALNASHPYIQGKYVLILDSDDRLTEDAVAAVREAWTCHQEQESVGVLTFLKGESLDRPLCTVNDFDIPVDIMRYKRIPIIGNDCCEVLRSELFQQYPFPVFHGERFLSECALWNQISLTHKCIYINKIIYLCKYLDDGLTKSGRKLRIQNPQGGMFISNLRMDKKNYLMQRLKYGLLYTCYGFFAGFSPTEIAKSCRAKLLMWICLPFGKLLHLYWGKKFSI